MKALEQTANKLKNYREKNHLTQAKMADILGISQSTLSRYETSGISDVEEIERVWSILGCEPITVGEREYDKTLTGLIRQYKEAYLNEDAEEMCEARQKLTLYFLPSPFKKALLEV